jgi:hypothetical protein
LRSNSDLVELAIIMQFFIAVLFGNMNNYHTPPKTKRRLVAMKEAA